MRDTRINMLHVNMERLSSLFWSLQPSCAFPVSQDKEEKCRHVLSCVLKASVSLIFSEGNLICLNKCHLLPLTTAVIYITQGLKAVDGTIKKESDLPAADPNTPIPLKYEDRSETGISSLLERGQSTSSLQTVDGWLATLKPVSVLCLQHVCH